MIDKEISTIVTDADKANGVKDEFGALYSPDGKQLLKGVDCTTYCIKHGTQVICDGAFSSCIDLYTINIPNSVALIGDSAFEECQGLSSIIIPNSVTHIGDSAFSGCYNLTEITISDSITHIGDNAFRGCISLKDITLPNSVIHIGDEAFYYCDSLTQIEITDKVKHIGKCAFSKCGRLSSIRVSNDNKIYDSRGNSNAIIHTATNTLIAGCETTIIPISVTQIGEGAFYGCEGISNITIPDSVALIGYSAFAGCISLSSITIPNSVTHIGDNAFSDCLCLTSIQVSRNNKIYDSREDCNAIIETASNSLAVGCQNTIIPNSVTSIGRHAFNGCDGLTSITIPNSVTHIGDGAFYGCSRLTNFTIPDSVTYIGDNAFYWCSNLINITIPNSVTHIGDHAFSWCRELTSITIPDSVTHIGKYAFLGGCDHLTSIIIPNASTQRFQKLISDNSSDKLTEKKDCELILATIVTDEELTNGIHDEYGAIYSQDGKRLLKGPNISSYEIKSGTKVICKKAFLHYTEYFDESIDYGGIGYDYNSVLKRITIPNTVIAIGDKAFYSCKVLTKVTIPDSVKYIGVGTFSRCYSLTSINIPDTIKNIRKESFSGCERLTSINIPGSVIHISEKAFSDCYSLTSINIPDTVTHIGYGAFDYCRGLASINIPDSVSYIGDYAFSNCKKLASIIIPSSVTHIENNTFNSCDSLAEIRIPVGSYDNFKKLLPGLECKFKIYEPPKPAIAQLSTEVTDEDIANGVKDEFGVIYSSDGKRLLLGVNFSSYSIKFGTQVICDDAFRGNKITNITIPKTVKLIGNGAFSYCLGLKGITIPNSVTHIGNTAFFFSGLTSIIIPNSVTHIGDLAFCYCHHLTSISIPNSVIHIGSVAFSLCRELTSVIIPDSVTFIGKRAFSACGSLTSIHVDENNKIYDSRENCNAIIQTATNTLIEGCKNTIIPNSITEIGDQAFYECGGLTGISIPDSVTHIGDLAFYACRGLTSVTIPNSVTHIGDLAFCDCTSLTSISIQNLVANISGEAFSGCNSISEIHIPKGSYDKFKQLLPGWEDKFVEDDRQSAHPLIMNETQYQIPDNYDSYQQKVIKLDEGYNLVLAPPGCGKTDILAERIARARSNGIPFSEMLCLTFTNRAARGMRDRIAKRMGKDVDTSSLFVGNTHRFCSKFLFEQNLVPMSTSILDENDATDIVESLIKKHKKGYEVVSYSVTRIFQLQHLIYQMKSDHPQDMWMNLSCIQNIRGLCHYLNLELGELYDKIEDINDNQYPPTYREAFRHLYLAKKYEEYKLDFGAIDFDDLLLMAYNFLSNPQSDFHKYNWIQIDEVQDLNPIQFAIVDKLTNDNNFVVVYLGDEQQAILSFIGAKLQTLDWLKKRCEGNLLHLYKNYRSPKYLLDVYNKFANDVLDADPDFLPEPNDSKEAEFGDLIVDHASEDTNEEYDRVVDYAEKYAKTGERVAIIVATNKDADEISDSMGDLKHFKISGQDVFSTPEIQMLLAHMNVINYELNNIAWAKIFRQMKLFGESARARDFSKSLVDHMLSPLDLLQYEQSSFVKEVTKAFEDEMVIFDTETTGLDVYEDDIVQIAAIRIQNAEVVEKFNIFLKTDKQIPEYLGEIRNPLFDEYPNAVKYDRDEGLTMFLEFVGTTPILGHNVEYDYHILDYNLQRDCGIENLNDICPVYYDSLKLARLVEPHLKVYKLKSLLEVLGLQGENSHMADDDILATYELVKYCVNKAKPRLNSQMDFMVSNHEIIDNFRKEYGPIYEHTKAMLYKRFPCDDTPAIVQEMDYIYNELKDKGIIKSNSKFKHILKFIEFDVIQKETERSLYEQLSNHSSELNTFKEADLCDSSTMEEKYFISTVHKAKGLEFENVIVFNAIDGVYPFFNSKTVEEQKEDARKFYVAISRAKKRLCIMTSKTKDVYSTKWHKWYNFNVEPTPFLKSISQFFMHIYDSEE